jgi:c-di-GMP-binding flagellar brake protein YcgR
MLLFKKKAKPEEVQPSSGPNPRQPRYDCVANVKVYGFEGQAVLRNVSIGGFRMESRTFAAMQPGEQFTMQIAPLPETGIASFEVKVEVRWVKSDVSSFNVGFLIVNPAAERYLTKYIEYLKQQDRR